MSQKTKEEQTLAREKEKKEGEKKLKKLSDRLLADLNAGVSHPGQVLSELDIAITTGNDDLRKSSNAYAYIRLARNSQVEEITSPSLNSGASWDNYTDHTYTWQFQSRLFQPAYVSDIKTFGIRFKSGQGFITDTGDNWNMQDIVVKYPVDNAPNDTLLACHGTDSDNPVHRFISDHDEWHVDF